MGKEIYRKYSNYLKMYCEVNNKEYELDNINFYDSNTTEILINFSFFHSKDNVYFIEMIDNIKLKRKFKLDGNNFIFKNKEGGYEIYINVQNLKCDFIFLGYKQNGKYLEKHYLIDNVLKTTVVKWLDRPQHRLRHKINEKLDKISENYRYDYTLVDTKELDKLFNQIKRLNERLNRAEYRMNNRYPKGYFFL